MRHFISPPYRKRVSKIAGFSEAVNGWKTPYRKTDVLLNGQRFICKSSRNCYNIGYGKQTHKIDNHRNVYRVGHNKHDLHYSWCTCFAFGIFSFNNFTYNVVGLSSIYSFLVSGIIVFIPAGAIPFDVAGGGVKNDGCFGMGCILRHVCLSDCFLLVFREFIWKVSCLVQTSPSKQKDWKFIKGAVLSRAQDLPFCIPGLAVPYATFPVVVNS